MKCPHCLTNFHAEQFLFILGPDSEGEWAIEYLCPNCKKQVLFLINANFERKATTGRIYYGIVENSIKERTLIRPKSIARTPVPKEVTKEIREEYEEACLVLTDSPKASAALSRRCLQHILRSKADVKHADLAREIQEVLDSNKLPGYIAEAIDAVRNVGNFAAHPMKSKATGEILPVEPEEAEWTLDVIEMLFDFYFVQPE